MAFFSRTLWLFPFLVHIAYLTATSRQFPELIGPDPATEIPRLQFFLEWGAIVLGSNTILLFVWKRMPRFSDRTLGVPNQSYWLHTPERRNELVERLQHLIESILFLINIFFIGIYQWIYQSSIAFPAMRLPIFPLVIGFVAMPLILIVFYLTGLVRTLKKTPQ